MKNLMTMIGLLSISFTVFTSFPAQATDEFSGSGIYYDKFDLSQNHQEVAITGLYGSLSEIPWSVDMKQNPNKLYPIDGNSDLNIVCHHFGFAHQGGSITQPITGPVMNLDAGYKQLVTSAYSQPSVTYLICNQ